MCFLGAYDVIATINNICGEYLEKLNNKRDNQIINR